MPSNPRRERGTPPAATPLRTRAPYNERKGEGKAGRRDTLVANIYYSQVQPIGLDAFLPTVAFFVAVTVVWSSKHIYPVLFYEVSAQVIPVLMLALALELRAFELPRRSIRFKVPRTAGEARSRAADPAQQELSDRLRGLLVLLAMIVGEGLVMIAIRVVFGQRPNEEPDSS